MLKFGQVTRALGALALVFAAACFPKGTEDPMTAAANMVAKSVPADTSLVGESAAPLPSVLVTNNGGKPVAKAAVSFSIDAGNGHVTAATVETDADGLASTGWTYGDVAGDNILTASLGTIAPVHFKVHTKPGDPASMTRVNDQQSGIVGEALAEPVAVIVNDKLGRPVKGATVQFTALNGSTTGGAGVTTASVATDDNGRAATPWTLGTTPGSYSLTAAVGTVPAVTFTATAIAGAPFALTASGGGQAGTVDTNLPAPIVITLRDKYGNAISGDTVTYQPQNGGAASPATDLTSSSGQSSTQWKLPTVAGPASLVVTAGGLSTTVTATANPGAPAQLEKMASSDNQSANTGAALPQAMSVTVRDAFLNPVPNVSVAFSPASGTVSASPVATDAFGQANTIWTMGSTAGATTLTVSAVGVAGSVVFGATAIGTSNPCDSHGTLAAGATVTGNLLASSCIDPAHNAKVDYWSLDLSSSTALEIVETMDDPASPDAYMTLYRGQADLPHLAGANDDIDIDNGNYNSHIRFLGGAGHFLVGATYWPWTMTDPGSAYHITANRWSGAVTACQDVYAVSGTSTTQQLDNDDCPANTMRAHADKVLITLRPGETLVVTMNATVFDTKLDLENGSGAVVASDDNSGGGTNARLTFTVPSTAPSVDLYSIFATSVVASAGGSYSFTVTVSTPPGTSSPMLSGARTSGTSSVGAGVQQLLGTHAVKAVAPKQ
jgi:5-hydroxyisourate hydrolase-like protein (transthyretin family)